MIVKIIWEGYASYKIILLTKNKQLQSQQIPWVLLDSTY